MIQNLKLFVLAILFNTCSILNAQYSFSVSNAAYSDLVSPNVLSSSGWSYATSFSVNLGFNFSFAGNTVNSINVEGGGFTFFDPSYNNLLLPFGCRLKAKAGGNSPISYFSEGTAPTRIMKIEWKNAEYFYDVNATANFQLWLFEGINRIEVHVGTCTVPNATLVYQGNGAAGPAVGAYKFVSINNCQYGIGLTGAAASPTVNNFLSGNINVFNYAVAGTPSTGTVYNFYDTNTGLEKKEVDENRNVFASDKSIYFQNIPQNNSVLIYNIQAKLVKDLKDVKERINAGDLENGIYFVRIMNEQNKQVFTKKILLN
ncbi:MAG: T9SS type A sorting domain-containing protein [Sphingobacteriaceae bacterium]|nr:T9SS type A sorting domain-containing protein [Sphingobacteriaceae bacterium]